MSKGLNLINKIYTINYPVEYNDKGSVLENRYCTIMNYQTRTDPIFLSEKLIRLEMNELFSTKSELIRFLQFIISELENNNDIK
jgi:hypothetical protein